MNGPFITYCTDGFHMAAMNARLLRPLASGFDPRRIAGLEAWWDAADAATITLNTTDPANPTVSEWRDKSGKGYHLAQSTAADQPAYSTTTNRINGRNTITFSGPSSQRLFNAALNVSVPVVFAVFRINSYTLSATTGAVVFDRYSTPIINTANPRCICGTLENSSSVLTFGRNTGDTVANATGTFSFGATQVVCCESFATGHSIYNNGVKGTDAADGTSTLDGIVVGNLRGSPNIIFNLTTYSLKGQLCELLVYSSALSTAQRQAVERWLGSRWGVTVT